LYSQAQPVGLNNCGSSVDNMLNQMQSLTGRWSKLKEILRSAKARTIEALDEAITDAINAITDEDALN
jgi:hypothetical protein